MAQRQSVMGVVLVALGTLFLAARWLNVGGEGVVALVGLAFLVAYGMTRQYGFLIPGGIMTGLGIGIIYENRLQANGAPVLLGLGLGFVAIYLISSIRGRMAGDWWPLIPGVVLTIIGLLLATDQTGLLGTVGRWWPLALVLIGLYIVFRRQARPEP